MNEALLQAAVNAMKEDRWLQVAILTASKDDVHRLAARAALEAALPMLRKQIAQELEKLLAQAEVALSKGCTCDYFYGSDTCTGRGDCGTPVAWKLSPDEVRDAVAGITPPAQIEGNR